MSRRERKMLRTRQDIIDAARSLFNSESYDSVTMDEIAEEADLSRATLYNHFDNKESIYYQIGVQYLADLRKSQQKIITSETSGIDQITKLSEDFLKALIENPIIYEIWRHFQSLLKKEVLTLRNTLDKIEFPMETELFSNIIHKRFYEEIRQLEKIWKETIKKGFKDGTIQKRLDADKLTHLLYLILLGMVDSIKSSRTLLTSINLKEKDIIEYTIEIIRNYIDT